MQACHRCTLSLLVLLALACCTASDQHIFLNSWSQRLRAEEKEQGAMNPHPTLRLPFSQPGRLWHAYTRQLDRWGGGGLGGR